MPETPTKPAHSPAKNATGSFTDQGREVIELSLQTLPRMLVAPEGPFCFELTKDDPTAAYDPGKSWRYTIMCLLGLARAEQAGFKSSVKITPMFEKMLTTAPNLGPGELGLMLWMAARINSPLAPRIAAEMDKKLETCNLDALEGMEVAWIMTGNAASQGLPLGDRTASNRRVLDYFFKSRVSRSGLILHFGQGWRRRFPNFATQIYSLHALSMCAKHQQDARCARHAVCLAENLQRLQRLDGGWPWLYDAEKGAVVEPFEVYSVHQHGMAPMAFFEYAEATGRDVRATLTRSLSWLSRNELNFPMIDHKTGLIYRSIRRTSPSDRLHIYLRMMETMMGRAPGLFGENPAGLEVNFTCRPYELGWTLEAWCGRD